MFYNLIIEKYFNIINVFLLMKFFGNKSYFILTNYIFVKYF